MRLLSDLLTKFVRKGTLRFYDARGKLHVFGGKEPGPAVTVRLHDAALERSSSPIRSSTPPKPIWTASSPSRRAAASTIS